jgi:uncharacterized protein (TIGR02996 family)
MHIVGVRMVGAPGLERHAQPARRPAYATAHPTLDKLWRNLLASPDDGTARLTYADALEEFGNPGLGEYDRANFIRSHIELAGYGPARKQYDWVDTFGTRRDLGHCFVEGPDEPKEGDRVDLTLPKEVAEFEMVDDDWKRLSKVVYKRHWPGVLVTSSRWTGRYENNRYEIAFKVDEESKPWPGASCLERCKGLFKLGDGRGDLGLPWHGAASSGLHKQPRPFVVEIWPSQSGGTMPAKQPRWRFVWRNGFPDHVECSTEDWDRCGPRIVLETPVVSWHNLSNPADNYNDAFVLWARRAAGLDKLGDGV